MPGRRLATARRRARELVDLASGNPDPRLLPDVVEYVRGYEPSLYGAPAEHRGLAAWAREHFEVCRVRRRRHARGGGRDRAAAGGASDPRRRGRGRGPVLSRPHQHAAPERLHRAAGRRGRARDVPGRARAGARRRGARGDLHAARAEPHGREPDARRAPRRCAPSWPATRTCWSSRTTTSGRSRRPPTTGSRRPRCRAGRSCGRSRSSSGPDLRLALVAADDGDRRPAARAARAGHDVGQPPAPARGRGHARGPADRAAARRPRAQRTPSAPRCSTRAGTVDPTGSTCGSRRRSPRTRSRPAAGACGRRPRSRSAGRSTRCGSRPRPSPPNRPRPSPPISRRQHVHRPERLSPDPARRRPAPSTSRPSSAWSRASPTRAWTRSARSAAPAATPTSAATSARGWRGSRSSAAGGVPVMVGIGAVRTEHVIAHAHDAQEAGAAAVMLAPVSYQALTEDEVYGLYADVTRRALRAAVRLRQPRHDPLRVQRRAARARGGAARRAGDQAARRRTRRSGSPRCGRASDVALGVSGDQFAAGGAERRRGRVVQRARRAVPGGRARDRARPRAPRSSSRCGRCSAATAACASWPPRRRCSGSPASATSRARCACSTATPARARGRAAGRWMRGARRAGDRPGAQRRQLEPDRGRAAAAEPRPRRVRRAAPVDRRRVRARLRRAAGRRRRARRPLRPPPRAARRARHLRRRLAGLRAGDRPGPADRGARAAGARAAADPAGVAVDRHGDVLRPARARPRDRRRGAPARASASPSGRCSAA